MLNTYKKEFNKRYAKQRKEWCKENPDKVNKYSRDSYHKNKDKILGRKGYKLINKICYVCGKNFEFYSKNERYIKNRITCGDKICQRKILVNNIMAYQKTAKGRNSHNKASLKYWINNKVKILKERKIARKALEEAEKC